MASANKTLNTDVPTKDVFALHFLQSLSNLRTQNPLNSPEETTDRVKKIKMAAYVSMARAAGGTNRLWSKALLRRTATENNKIIRFSRRKRKVTWQISSGRRERRSSNQKAPVVEEVADRLRKFVPGGGGMETSKLMEETAHYIQCLSMQVKVMQCLVDGLSPK